MLTDSSRPVNILPNGIEPENSNFTATVCNVAIVLEMANETSLSSVRTLPKKRKFDLSALEETSYAKRESVELTITPPQSTAVDYSRVSNSVSCSNANEHVVDNGRGTSMSSCNSDSSPPKLTPQKTTLSPVFYQEAATSKGASLPEYYKPSVNLSVPTLNVSSAQEYSGTCEKPNIALHEWIDHRVLAKQNCVYSPGTIRKADSTNGNVWVEFDNNGEELIVFLDVLQNGRYDVISDASPTLVQVGVGARVCVRTSSSSADDKQQSRLFVEGIVHKILMSPVQFVVRLLGPEHKEYMVKRADIRLLQPPWADELENDYENELPPRLLPYGNIPTSSSNSNLLSVVHSNSYQQTPSLDPASKVFCRSAAMSPLRVTPIVVGAGSVAAALTSGSVDERSKRFEEYCESDDELRKENILFSSMENG